MSTYSSQTVAHVGALIALFVGVGALLYQLDFNTFFGLSRIKRSLFFYFPFSLLLGIIAYVFFRLIFWAWMSSEVLGVSQSMALNLMSQHPNVPSFTMIAAIQQYCISEYTNVPSWSSYFYTFCSHGLDYSILLIIIFAIPILVTAIVIDYLNEYFKKNIHMKEKIAKWLEYQLKMGI
jgi:hypothetical protein